MTFTAQYESYPSVQYSFQYLIDIVDASAKVVPEFFTEAIKPIYVKIGEDFTWTLPDLNDTYTVQSIEIVNAAALRFISFDQSTLTFVIDGAVS